MRVCQIGHCELVFFLEARVAVLGQLFMPVPQIIAQYRVAGELVVDAQFHHAVNVAQRFF